MAWAKGGAAGVANLKTGRVWVVGSLNIDHTMYVDSLPALGETVLATGMEVHPGGKGANQAVACARLEAPTSLVACVGHDAVESGAVDEVGSYGVDVSGVQVGKSMTGTALAFVDKAGNNFIGVSEGANAEIDASRCSFETGDAVLLQCEIPLRVLAEVAGLGRAAGSLVVVNASPATVLPAAVLSNVDLLVVNEIEAEIALHLAPGVMASVVTGDSDAQERLISATLLTGVAVVAVTMGSLGSVLVAGGELSVQRAFTVDAVDAVGAGDAFVGALVACRLAGAPLLAAMSWASAAAALTVTSVGTLRAFPGRQEVIEFLGDR
jgi:ribokinase